MVGGTAAGVINAVIPSTSQISQWEPSSGGGVRLRSGYSELTNFFIPNSRLGIFLWFFFNAFALILLHPTGIKMPTLIYSNYKCNCIVFYGINMQGFFARFILTCPSPWSFNIVSSLLLLFELYPAWAFEPQSTSHIITQTGILNQVVWHLQKGDGVISHADLIISWSDPQTSD